jgi:hypothetical protein
MPPLMNPVNKYMHAFSVRPDVKFETQENDEEIILVLRSHPITQISWGINAIFLLVVLIVANIFFTNFLSPVQLTYMSLMGVLFIMSYVWLNFLLYFFNVGIVTNKRIIDIDFYSILYREISETRISKVEDITAKSAGYFGSLFNFGNVYVQTAGAEVNIEFESVPAPSEVVKIINDLQT